ncbi:MAG: hypothetical protein QM756_30975 [Polyangiaceae bacterium]
MVVLGLLGLAASSVYPRAKAAWEIHALGTSMADYSLCMVGPTGPETIRDDIEAFRRLVRRRLVNAAPDEAPFARCAPLARELGGSAEVERTHAAKAQTFVEYGLDGGKSTLAALRVDGSLLIQRARAAWPFIRGNPAQLVRGSLGAREAVHPVAPAPAGVGRGLPPAFAMPKNTWRAGDSLLVSLGNNAGQTSFVSSDGGASFRPTRSAPGAEERSGRCVGKDPSRGFSLSSSVDGSLLVSAFVGERAQEPQAAVRGEHRLLAVACDEDALVVASRSEGSAQGVLTLCRSGHSCVPLALPAVAPFAALSSDGFDLARVAGATVLAMETRGIVRVVSTRDDGASWTPPNVAFDVAEPAAARADVTVPNRLIAFGSRLFLYGAAQKGSQSYALLASDDQGASFRSPNFAARPAADVARAGDAQR